MNRYGSTGAVAALLLLASAVPALSAGTSENFASDIGSVPESATISAAALLAPAPQARSAPAPSPEIRRARAVTMNLDALTPDSPRAVAVELFPDLTAVISPTRIDSNERRTIWRGAVEGPEGGSALIAIRNGVAFGEVRIGLDRVIEIRPAEAGVYHVVELDQFAIGACATGPEHVVNAPVGPDAGQAAGLRGARVADVMVLYTDTARDAAGGTANIESLIEAAVSVTNDAYTDSAIGLQLNLIYLGPANYEDSGSIGTDLDRFRGTTDGFMDDVHQLRNDYGADLVALINNGGGACGVAYKMGVPSSGFASSAFSVTARSCAVGNRTFAHELGHNMGCNHDRDNSGGGGSYAYSYGYRTPNEAYRSIMAYAPGTRVPLFSSPDVFWAGFPLGTEVIDPQPAYNALSIHNNRDTIADWRPTATISQCVGDFTGDGVVNAADLGALLGTWGPGEGPADINNDGVVNAADLAMVLGSWGPCPE